MKDWYDRVSGEFVEELPKCIHSGQYIANSECIYNSHSEIQKGNLVLDDGSHKFKIGNGEGVFSSDNVNSFEKTELNIIENSLESYYEAVKQGRPHSFLIPEKLLVRFELSELENSLFKILEGGYFHEIARNPKAELLYEEYLVPVSRAKKLAPKSHQYLASHSKCWQARSFTGVVPKTMLALENEDNLNIYENRVFVKLLEHLEVYLNERYLEVKRLESIFEHAGSFNHTESLYYELSEGIYKLWGEGFSNDARVDEFVIKSENTLKTIESMLHSVRTLQQSILYRELINNLHVPLSINMTNVLSHDKYYRYVAVVWHMWLDSQQKATKVEPKIIYNRNRFLANTYTKYCYDLINRALKELGHTSINLKIDDQFSEIVLHYKGSTIFFVPIFSSQKINKNVESNENNNRIIISLDGSIMPCSNICASPTNFYSLELISVLLAKYFAQIVFSKTIKQVDKIPTRFLEELNELNDGFWDIDFDQQSVVARKPFTSVMKDIFLISEKYQNDQTIQKFPEKFSLLANEFSTFLICPVCGVKANENNWVDRDNYCFKIQKSNCKHRWSIDRHKSGKKDLVISPKKHDEEIPYSFDNYGRYFWRIKL
jgi:hypothetical protein